MIDSDREREKCIHNFCPAGVDVALEKAAAGSGTRADSCREGGNRGCLPHSTLPAEPGEEAQDIRLGEKETERHMELL